MHTDTIELYSHLDLPVFVEEKKHISISRNNMYKMKEKAFFKQFPLENVEKTDWFTVVFTKYQTVWNFGRYWKDRHTWMLWQEQVVYKYLAKSLMQNNLIHA